MRGADDGTAKMNTLWMQLSAWPPVRKCLDRLGMKVVPFFLFLERLSFADLSPLSQRFGDYETGLLGPRDMAAVAAIPGRDTTPEAVYQKRLKAGNICCGTRHRGDLVAYTWADMERCDSILYGFSLKPKEAYLFDAFTTESYRGRGIAPYLRWHSYRELAQLDKVDLYSYSLYSNAPAIRFKRKLNAQIVGVGIYTQFLNRPTRGLLLRKR
jgi:hypothetical protein